jgi:integrase
VRIPLVEPLGSHLRSLKARSQDAAVSPTLDGLPAGHVHGLSAQFKTHLEAVGIVGRTVKGKGTKGRAFNSKTFHSLRHTCNSLMANAGVSADVRIAILGHATKKMNERYTHLSDATTGQALVEAITKAVS